MKYITEPGVEPRNRGRIAPGAFNEYKFSFPALVRALTVFLRARAPVPTQGVSTLFGYFAIGQNYL